ncbi:MAG TPA: FUSC family protein [Solirubrobacterales bacterium]|nr:FUSC family protein [Solirubrobacterales bacterium]
MAGPATSRLYDASGQARRLRASPLLAIGPAEPGPALRRGALVAVPVALALIFEFAADWPSQGAIATAALLCGFTALDAPAGPRAVWQAATAPFVGISAALGVLASQWAPAAVIAMGLIAAAAGYCFADTQRLAFVGFACAVALMLAEGLFLPVHDTLPALLYGVLGGLIQAAWAACVWLFFDRDADSESGWDWARTRSRLRANLTLASPIARHSLRFGVALALGVAIYRIAGMRVHGYWIPLTILFVLRPERAETDRRLVLRAVGTIAGLALATSLAFAVDGAEVPIGIVLGLAAALSLGLITVQYALFTTAMTTYVVLLSDTLGEARLHAASQRLLGTAAGIVISYLAFRVYPGPGERRSLPLTYWPASQTGRAGRRRPREETQ